MADTATRAKGDELAFDPTDREFRRNPYPRYAELRRAPALPRTEDGVVMLTRYDDVLAAVHDRRLSSNPAHAKTGRRADRAELFRFLGDDGPKIMLVADPPDHTRLRRLANRAFTVRAVERLRPRIEELVEGLLDQMAASPEPDVMHHLAEPLPVMVICELLGVPVEDQDQFKPWSTAIARMLDPDVDQAMLMNAVPAVMGFVQYFRDLMDERRATPTDDLLTALMQAESEGDSLSVAELFAMIILLFIAGHETTTNLIGNGTLALLRNPDQYRLLREHPDLAVAATEELLRFDSPVQVTMRTATEDMELNGIALTAGESVICGLAAANRDPEFVADPEALRVDRDAPLHLSFSHGMHHCLGAPLARLEGQIGFAALTRRFPELRLAVDDPPYRDHFVLRGLAALPVQLS